MDTSEFIRQPAQILIYMNSTNQELNTSKLAKLFKIYQGNMAKIIKKLENMGLIKKETGRNKREIKISLTKKGKKIADNFLQIKYELN